VSGHLGLWSAGLSDGYRGSGRYASLFIPGLSAQKYQGGEVRGLSRGKNGVAGYQGFIKVACGLIFNIMFLIGFY
jgi:hypothetical protein